MFDLVMPGDLLGYVTKEASEATLLPEGCPVIATANDKAAEGLGAGLRDDGSVLVSLGTYIGGMMRGKAYTDTASEYWSNLSAIPYEYLYETSVGIRRGILVQGASWRSGRRKGKKHGNQCRRTSGKRSEAYIAWERRTDNCRRIPGAQ